LIPGHVPIFEEISLGLGSVGVNDLEHRDVAQRVNAPAEEQDALTATSRFSPWACAAIA
jgi:hypothetical protein